MFKAEFLVLLDQRLRELYDRHLPFGSKSILLTGDFWQLQVIKAISLCKAMFMQTTNPTLLKARQLFSLFTVFKLKEQHRASNCPIQQALLSKFRELPSKYPVGNRWSKDDAAFRPIGEDIVSVLTKELTKEDIMTNSGWITDSTILVTSNVDRAVLNACMAKVLDCRSNTILCRWRKPLVESFSEAVQEVMYNENEHPELFGYFFPGAPAQILDNANGNVNLGVANGTRCWYHSIGWDDEQSTAKAMALMAKAKKLGQQIVDLPFPPQYINVKIADRDGKPRQDSTWPTEMNLNTPKTDGGTTNVDTSDIVIPVGRTLSNGENYAVNLRDTSQENISYYQHAVDLAMALTVWKAQGGTFGHVILLLEGSQHAPRCQFEHLYVAISRVRAAHLIRCFPVLPLFDRGRLYKLRPNIFTVKWYMDIDESEIWRPRHDTSDPS